MPISLCALIFCLFLPKAEASKPVIDNERVTVYDVTLAKGLKTSAEPHPLDVVRVYLTEATIRTTQPDGKSSALTRKAGDAVFEPRGTSIAEEVISGDSAREAVIELKDHKVEPLPNTSGLPDAFPRQGSKKLLENDRVTVWDYRWLPEKPTVMHFHGKDVVVIYLEDGVLRSVTPDGKTADNTFSAPTIRFSPRNRTHYEQLMSGSERAIATELK